MEAIFQMDEDTVGGEEEEAVAERRPAARVQRRHVGGARRHRRPRDTRRAGSAASLPPAAPIIGSMPDSGMDVPPLSLPPSVEQDPVAERQPSVASFREHTDYLAASCPAFVRDLEEKPRKPPGQGGDDEVGKLSTSLTALSLMGTTSREGRSGSLAKHDTGQGSEGAAPASSNIRATIAAHKRQDLAAVRGAHKRTQSSSLLAPTTSESPSASAGGAGGVDKEGPEPRDKRGRT